MIDVTILEAPSDVDATPSRHSLPSSIAGLSLYIHIPFCHLRCNFCNLHAYGMGEYTALPNLRADYAAALVGEIEMWAARAPNAAISTVFFGGGTPTELTADQLGAILATVRQNFDVSADAEITVEGYPGLGADTLARLREHGVTRTSFGVQSFEPHLARLLDREHTPDEVAQTVGDAKALGFSVALDFIYGLPTQTMAHWQATINQALALAPDHLSLYALSIEEATRLRALIKQGVLPAPDGDLTADMYRWAQKRLASGGFEHYEISNWATPGHACRHNQVYWRNDPWLGLGAGAYGWYNGDRYTNILAPTHYVEAVQAGRVPMGRHEPIDRQTEMKETVMLGLRLREGLDLDRFAQRFGVAFMDVYGRSLPKLIDWGLLTLDGNRLRLADAGLLISNEILTRLLP